MSPRQYTVEEIDRMRQAILRRMDGKPAGCGYEVEMAWTRTTAVVVEEMLRTYMAASVNPNDVIRPEEQADEVLRPPPLTTDMGDLKRLVEKFVGTIHACPNCGAPGNMATTELIRDLWRKIIDVDAAVTEFAKASHGISLTIQQHDPSWRAWRRLCDLLRETK